MIQIQCPSCAKSYRVPEAHVGSRASCASCGHTFTLVIAVDDTLHPAARSSAENYAQQKVHSKPVPVANADNGLESAQRQVAHYVLKRKLA